MTAVPEIKRPYRASFILDTRNFEGSVDDLVARLTDLITTIEGENIEVDNLGNTRFARASRKGPDSGHLISVVFDGPPSSPRLIHEKTRLDRSIDRVMVEVLTSR